VVKTLDKNTLIVKNLSAESTVLELKKRIHLEWTGTSPGKQQLLFGTVDLVDDSRTLGSYGVFGPGTEGPGSGTGTDIPVITMYSLVNMLTHQGRFINLQRYVWSGGALKVLSPLAAVDDVKSLQDGVLASSSLSMTSRDSFLLWEEMSRYCVCTIFFFSLLSLFSQLHFFFLSVVNHFYIFLFFCPLVDCSP
jgi:Ubiquitin family